MPAGSSVKPSADAGAGEKSDVSGMLRLGGAISLTFALAACGAATASPNRQALISSGVAAGDCANDPGLSTACPSQTGPNAESSPQVSSAYVPPSQTPNDANAAGYIGTYSASLSGGGSYSLAYSVGTPETDPNAASVAAGVASCHGNFDMDPNLSVYVPISIHVSYSGSLATTVSFGNNGANSGKHGVNAQTNLFSTPEGSGGQWTCYQNQRQFPSFAPGSTETVNEVFMVESVLSNNNPTFIPSQHADWYVDGDEVRFPGSGAGTFAGPNKCATAAGLSLFGPAGSSTC